MSDAHDNWPNLTRAVSLANDDGCEVLLFAGDLVSPPGVAILAGFTGVVKFVWGNNEGERMGLTRKMDATKNMELGGDIYEGELDGLKVWMTHSPRVAELAAKSGEFDLCVCGHTHEYRQEKLGKTLLLNPGAVATGQFAIFDTVTKIVKSL